MTDAKPKAMDDAWTGVMIEYMEQDVPGGEPYKRSVPGWQCTNCGKKIGIAMTAKPTRCEVCDSYGPNCYQVIHRLTDRIAAIENDRYLDRLSDESDRIAALEARLVPLEPGIRCGARLWSSPGVRCVVEGLLHEGKHQGSSGVAWTDAENNATPLPPSTPTVHASTDVRVGPGTINPPVKRPSCAKCGGRLNINETDYHGHCAPVPRAETCYGHDGLDSCLQCGWRREPAAPPAEPTSNQTLAWKHVGKWKGFGTEPTYGWEAQDIERLLEEAEARGRAQVSPPPAEPTMDNETRAGLWLQSTGLPMPLTKPLKRMLDEAEARGEERWRKHANEGWALANRRTVQWKEAEARIEAQVSPKAAEAIAKSK
jgi:hypothetical protein